MRICNTIYCFVTLGMTYFLLLFFKQKTAYEMRISDWSSDVCSSDLPGLAKAALAVKVDGALRDLARPIEGDATVEIVTASHADALELLRHDCAHVLAEAVQELYPGTQVTFGPAIEIGSASGRGSGLQ